jgi:hypothetical protein
VHIARPQPGDPTPSEIKGGQSAAPSSYQAQRPITRKLVYIIEYASQAQISVGPLLRRDPRPYGGVGRVFQPRYILDCAG